MSDTDPSERVVDDILDEALAEFAGVVPDEVLAAIRAELADQLLTTERGLGLVRQATPDPKVERSADVEVVGAEQPVGVRPTGTLGGEPRRGGKRS